MAFEYKLEYTYDGSLPSDSSVYIHMRNNPPIYQAKIDKEDYDILPFVAKHPFLTGLFSISGVVELSSRAYRVWLMKSPVYNWDEVLLPSLYWIAGFYGESQISSLPGSANESGIGVTIELPVQRRKL